MKVRNFALMACAALTLGLVSCEQNNTETKEYMVTFEDVTLGEQGYWDGSDMQVEGVQEEDEWGSMTTNYYSAFVSGVASFNNKYTKEYGSWLGFACSSLTDTKTPGYENQYSVVAGSGAYASKNFAVAFKEAVLECPQNEYGYMKAGSVMLANSTYAYLSMKDGDSYTAPFEAGSWFKVIVTGYRGEAETGKVEYYLADFRDGKSFLSNQWETVDLSALGEVDKMAFGFDSSDKGEYGINTPTYVCVDNLLLTQEVEKQ